MALTRDREDALEAARTIWESGREIASRRQARLPKNEGRVQPSQAAFERQEARDAELIRLINDSELALLIPSSSRPPDTRASADAKPRLVLLCAGASQQLAAIQKARRTAVSMSTLTTPSTLADKRSDPSTSDLTVDTSYGPASKRLRKISGSSVNTSASDRSSLTPAASAASITTEVRSTKSKGRKPLVKRPSEMRDSDFTKRFPTAASFVEYLSGPSDSVHPIQKHRDAPLIKVRAVFVSPDKKLSKHLALNIENLVRLGGTAQQTFISPFSTDAVSISDAPTTHVIVCSPQWKFKDVVRALELSAEVDLVGRDVTEGLASTGRKRDVWVVRLSWLQECCSYAQRADVTARKASELGHLVESEGDKLRRKERTLEKSREAQVVVEAAFENFRMPHESQST